MKNMLGTFGIVFGLLAAAIGCSERPVPSDAEGKAAVERFDALLKGYAARKDPADIDRMLDALKVAVSGTNEFSATSRLPFLGFLHNAFVANPGRADEWKGRSAEFAGSVVAGVLKEALDFDEKGFLKQDAEPGLLDYCWGAFYATGDIAYAQKVVSIALDRGPENGINLCQMAAAWSLKSFAVEYPAVAKCLNDALRTADESSVERIAELFGEEEREKCFDAGIRMKLGIAHPLEHRTKPPALDGRWRGLDDAEEWIENARTNRAIETCASFRDGEFVPFAVRELLGGAETNATARTLAAEFATSLYDAEEVAFSRSSCEEAKRLVDGGCRVPFVRWLALPMMGKGKTEILDAIEQIPGRSVVDVLAAYWRYKADRSEKNGLNLVGRVVEWICTRGLRDGGARCAVRILSATVPPPQFTILSEMLERCESVDPWLPKMLAAVAAKNAAWDARGRGWASSVSEEGWAGYRNQKGIAHDLFEEARKIHPDYSDFSAAEANTHGGDDEWLDGLFGRMTMIRLDEYALYDAYAFYALYPRWGGSAEKMERFADICYATGRHDTMITSLYAQLQLEAAYEKGVTVEEQFSDPVRLGRFLEVCEAQATNKNAYVKVRNRAYYARAVVLGRLGRYREIGDYAAERHCREVPTWPKRLAEAVAEEDLGLCGLTGPHGMALAVAHALYRAGSWKECLDAYVKVGAIEGLTEAERRYVSAYRRSATIFSKKGGEIAADYSDADEFFAPEAYWHVDAVNGIWCKGDKNIKACSLRWNVPLPSEHVVAFDVERRYTDANFNRAYLKVDTGFCGDTFSRRPSCYVFIEGNRAGVSVVASDVNRAEAKQKAVWRPYDGGRLSVKVKWSDKGVSAWIGDLKEPVVFECANCVGCCRTKKSEPTAVREKFFGWNVKIHGLKALSGD